MKHDQIEINDNYYSLDKPIAENEITEVLEGK
jgi:hypothetical protein